MKEMNLKACRALFVMNFALWLPAFLLAQWNGTPSSLANVNPNTVHVGGVQPGNNEVANDAVSIGLGGGSAGWSIAIGARALLNNNNGFSNIAIGRGALSGMVLVGGESVVNNNGVQNIAIGHYALRRNTGVAGVSASWNTAIGYNSMQLNSSGSRNTALGWGSLGTSTTGNDNVAVGWNSLSVLNSTSAASGNTALGYNAAGAMNTGTDNVIIGRNAALYRPTGGTGLVTGNNNVAIGAGALMGDGNNQLNIQNCIWGIGMGTATNNGNIGIGIGATTAVRLYIGGSGSIPSLRLNNVLTVPAAANRSYLFVDNDGTVTQALLPAANGGPTNNTLSSAGNTMTSTVNGVAANAPIVNQVVNAVAGGQLTTTVNGISSNAVPIDGPIVNNLVNDGVNTLTSTVNGIASAAAIINQVTTGFDPNTNDLTIGVNGINSVINISTGGVTTLYSGNGHIANTTNGIREVTMDGHNIWFRAATDQPNGGKIYIGANDVSSVTNPTPQFGGDFKLYVEQGILTERVKVAVRTTNNWADYVFASNYKLMPIQEVESFIKTNKHLPGVASADELTKTGLDLGVMQAKQMEKIEELTLYIIDQNKMIEKQSAEIEALKAQMKILLEKSK